MAKAAVRPSSTSRARKRLVSGIARTVPLTVISNGGRLSLESQTAVPSTAALISARRTQKSDRSFALLGKVGDKVRLRLLNAACASG